MKLRYLFLALVLVGNVLAANTDWTDYTGITHSDAIYLCDRSILNSVDREINIKYWAGTGLRDLVTSRYCPHGNSMSMPYERRLWIKTDLLNSDLSMDKSDYGAFKLLNDNTYNDVFSGTSSITRGQGFLYLEDFVTVTDPHNANNHLMYDLPYLSDVSISKIDAGFYHAISTGNGKGLDDFYNSNTGLFASQNTFTEAGLAYPPSDLSNPGAITLSGRTCNTDYRCVSDTSLDVSLNSDASKAFFAFDGELNYYYYPYFIDSVEYTISGYAANNATLVFSKKGSLPDGKTVLYFPLTNVVRDGLVGDFYLTDSTFNFPSEMNYDGVVATLPTDVYMVKLELTTILAKNPLYRHETPVDYTWSIYNLTNGDCAGGDLSSSLCNAYSTKNLRMRQTTYFNLSDNTSTAPVVPPSNLDDADAHNDFDTNITNSTGVVPDLNSNNNISGGSGVDWVSDPNGGGALQGQIQYAQGKMNIENKASFFMSLQSIAEIILELILTVFMLIMLFVSVYVFFLMIPSAYRKLLDEFKKLGDMRWR